MVYDGCIINGAPVSGMAHRRAHLWLFDFVSFLSCVFLSAKLFSLVVP